MRTLALFLLLLSFGLSAWAQPSHDQIRWQDKTRKFIKFIPYDWDGEESLPLVINMHPFLTDGSFQMNYTRFNWVADTAKMIVVYPSGIQGRWNSGAFAGIESPIDDVGFLDRLIDYMAIMYNIDTRKVYATGYSAGGFMSHKLACDLTNRITAIAPVSASMNPETLESCNPDRPVPVQIFNGTADAIVNYDGFELAGTSPAEDVLELWRNVNGCGEIPVTVELPDLDPNDNTITERRTFSDCDGGSEIIFNKVLEGGHTWPGRNFPLLGNTAQDIKANEEIVSFFKRHQIPDELSCERPSGLSSQYEGRTVSLSWNPVTGIDFYNLLYFHTDGEVNYLEGLQDNTYQIEDVGEGEVIWVVRSQCESGHVSWSGIQRDAVNGRLDGGRIEVIAYPNPVMDELHIDIPGRTTDAAYAIYDPMGNQVESGVLERSNSYVTVSHLPAGVYHLVINEGSAPGSTFRKW